MKKYKLLELTLDVSADSRAQNLKVSHSGSFTKRGYLDHLKSTVADIAADLEMENKKLMIELKPSLVQLTIIITHQDRGIQSQDT